MKLVNAIISRFKSEIMPGITDTAKAAINEGLKAKTPICKEVGISDLVS